MRASDTDRQRAVDELRRHCAAGRLDVDEYASRVERAHAASTLEELDELRADLPIMRVAEPAGRGRVPVGSTLVSRRAGASGVGVAIHPKVAAAAVATVTVLVVLGAVSLALASEWVWAVLLLAGWGAGVLQGRLSRNTRRSV